MKKTVFALFNDSKDAGEAISRLKQEAWAKDISLVSKDYTAQPAETKTVKQDVGEGATVGGVTGAAFGALAALVTGLSLIAIPGIGLVVAGPLATALTSAAAGAAVGSLVGALVDWGVPEEEAKLYEKSVAAGQVLVATTVEEEHVDHTKQIYENCNAQKVSVSGT